ncbi:hypothetical protein [Microbacterium oleivorans]|uniref:hypothetical protein n=1 Tax=Microbacterium oleivorans TaxID=273677 RepID=UPI00080E3459|nr:hypothetical protein [Microbacterium oleivorans]
MAGRAPELAARRRLILGVHVWWDAVTSRAFFTRPALWISLIVSVSVLAPFQHFSGPSGYLHVVIVAVIGWAVLVAALLPVARAEQRIERATTRGILILTAVTIAAALRPFVNEGVYVLLYSGSPDVTGLIARVVSNIVVWVAGLSIIAMTVRSIELTRGSRARLSVALVALTDGRRRLARFEGENRELLAPLISRLRRRREEMLSGTIDFAAVRDYSEEVRTASHRLEERSGLDLRVIAAAAEEHDDIVPQRSALTMLRPTPYLLTGFVFLLGAVPYVHHLAGPWAAAGAILLATPVTVLADLLIRRLARDASPAHRGRVIVGVWVAAGVVMSLVTHVFVGPENPTRFVPLVSLPLVAVALAACTDAIARASDSAHRLEAVLALVARTLTAKTAAARRPLRNAAHVLHGRVQGRCVLLAAAADEWELTPDDIARFRRETDAAFDSILAFVAEVDSAALEGTVQSAHEDLSELVATWRSVVGVDSTISPAATDALTDPALSRRVATIVNEGFVNAIKHSIAKQVWVDIDVTGDTLLVRTWSTGTLDKAPVVAPQLRGISVLGSGARIYQRDDAVVLEVPVPLSPVRETVPTPIAVLPRRARWTRRTARARRVG